MPYSHTTFAAAKTQLSEMLGDTGKVFWTDAELGVYVVESLRMWNALTGHWRSREQFLTDSGEPFYDLGSKLAVRNLTVTDSSLLAAIQYHLLEPSTATSWTGTDQFSLSEVTNALERRRNQFLFETGTILARSNVAMPPPPAARTNLPDTVIDVRRLAWKTVEAYYFPMWREDEWSLIANDPVWPQNPDRPLAFSVTGTPPITVQVAPPPIDLGTMDMLAVHTAADCDPTVGVPMGVSDDLAWVVKFGALADLLAKDGPGKDIPRAEYCEMRWREGLQIAKVSTSLIQAYVNEVPVWLCGIAELDALEPKWQNSSGTPSIIAQAGLNLIGAFKIPDGQFSLSFDLVRNAVVPSVDADNIQLGREHLDAVLAYAQHLASFKMGGAEFEATTIHYNRLLQLAASQNEKLRASARYFTALHDKAAREESFRPRRAAMIQ